jgi:hypothetical protein
MGTGLGDSAIGIRGALAALAVAIVALVALPATAQVTFGSPSEPARLALGAGAFNITPSSSHSDSRTAAEFRGEYRFVDVWWIISPFVGASVTSQGAAYGYFGFGFDINVGTHLVVTPNVAAGFFEKGSGLNLGSWWEFRTGGEIAYRFDDQSRLGIEITHTSNAGIGKRNPGEQSALLMYSIPLH